MSYRVNPSHARTQLTVNPLGYRNHRDEEYELRFVDETGTRSMGLAPEHLTALHQQTGRLLAARGLHPWQVNVTPADEAVYVVELGTGTHSEALESLERLKGIHEPATTLELFRVDGQIPVRTDTSRGVHGGQG